MKLDSHRKTNTVLFHIYKILRVDKIIGQKVEWWFSWVKERVKWGVNV